MYGIMNPDQPNGEQQTAHMETCIYLDRSEQIDISPELRILTGKEHPKIKLQRVRKIRIWTFGSLVHQIKSF